MLYLLPAEEYMGISAGLRSRGTRLFHFPYILHHRPNHHNLTHLGPDRKPSLAGAKRTCIRELGVPPRGNAGRRAKGGRLWQLSRKTPKDTTVKLRRILGPVRSNVHSSAPVLVPDAAVWWAGPRNSPTRFGSDSGASAKPRRSE
ncbi:hypothetical protein PG989_005646 [Apiospora arundinis]